MITNLILLVCGLKIARVRPGKKSRCVESDENIERHFFPTLKDFREKDGIGLNVQKSLTRLWLLGLFVCFCICMCVFLFNCIFITVLDVT